MPGAGNRRLPPPLRRLGPPRSPLVRGSVAPTGSAYDLLVVGDNAKAFFTMGDASGHLVDRFGNNTTSEANLTYGVPGIPGDTSTAIAYNGTNSTATLPDNSALAVGNGPFSIELWVKRSAIGSVATMATKGSTGGSAWILFFPADNTIRFARADTFAAIMDSGATTVTDTTTWHHIVATKSGAARALYLDGVAVTSLGADFTLLNSTDVLTIGNTNFPGALAKVAIYPSVVLSPAQVLAHYTAGSTAAGTTYSVTASDTSTVTDEPVRVLAGLRAASDSGTLTDAITRLGAFARTAADSGTSTEAPARAVAASRAAADILTTTDNAAGARSFARSAADSTAGASAVARVLVAGRSAADSGTLDEAVVRTFSAARSAGDSSTQTEAPKRIAVLIRAAADATTGATAAVRVIVLARSAADATAGGTSATATVGATSYTRSAADSLSTVDAVVRALVLGRSASEALATASAAVRVLSLPRTVADARTTTDAILRVLASARTAGDSGSTTAAAARLVQLFRLEADAVAVSEFVVATRYASIGDGIPPTLGSIAALLPTLTGAPSLPDGAVSLAPRPQGHAESVAPRGEAEAATPRARS